MLFRGVSGSSLLANPEDPEAGSSPEQGAALLLHWLAVSVTFCLHRRDQKAVSKRFSFPSGYPTVSERVSLSAHYSGDGGWGNQPSIAPHRSGSHCSHGETWHWSVLAAWPLALGRALFISFFSTSLT